jgi:hypothetical protein
MVSRLQYNTILVLSLCLCMATPILAGEASHLLDGRAFVGLNGEKGRDLDPDQHEEIVFQSGRFQSLSCAPYNFGDAEYSLTTIGNVIHFEAETVSPTHGKIAWEGLVDGNTAEMTFVWTKERWYWDIRREYWFKGTLKE